MNNNKYNSRVRQAISDEYVKCSKNAQEYLAKCNELESRLEKEADTLPYKEYIRLQNESKNNLEYYRTEKIKLDICDAAREICLKIADEK